MIEKQTINGKEIWLKIDPRPVERESPNIIPTEYFTASYYLHEPAIDLLGGTVIKNEEGSPELFESPVAALASAWKKVEKLV